MTVHMLRYEVKPEHRDELEAGIREVFAAVEEEQPEGVRYSVVRLPDGVSIVGLLELADGVDNPLPALPAAQRLQASLRDWVAGEPQAPETVDVLGSYRLFG